MRMIKFFVAAALATGCVPMTGSGGYYGGSTYGASTHAEVTTGVYVNGVELDATTKAKLDWLLSYTVPAGRYFVTEAGMMGVEGQHATINLIAYAEARGIDVRGNQNTGHAARGTIFGSGYGNGSITSDGSGCTIVSSGASTFSSGC
jgi:hypothetical protein